MDYIVIEGVKPYDGRWPLDASEDFTTREWGLIKRLSGYLPLTIKDGFGGGDPELFAAFAIVALLRAGQIQAADAARVFDLVGAGPFASTIRLAADPEPEQADEGDAGPPERSSTSSTPTSGDGSPTSSETSEPYRNGSGIPVSASSVSGPPMWET